MKKCVKKRWLLAAMLVVAMGLLMGCGSKSQATTPLVDSVTVEEYMGVAQLDEQQQITAEVSYPVLSSDSNQQAVQDLLAKLNGMFQQDAEAFVQQAADGYLANAQAGDTFVYAAEVAYNAKGMVSVVQTEQFAGQAYLQYGATYSLGNGEKMTLGELLDMEQTEAETLVAQQFGGVVQTDPDTFYENAQAYVQNHVDEMEYYRCDEGLDVFFQAGIIAPESAGILEMVMQ